MKNSGYLVMTKGGKKGRTFHSKGFIKGKVPVYLEKEKFEFEEIGILCDKDSLEVIGFIN